MSQMPVGEPIPATLRAELNKLREDIDRLSQPKRDLDEPRLRHKEVVFSCPGIPEYQQSVVYHVSDPEAYITEARMSLRDDVSGDNTEMVILVNGDDAHTIVHDPSAEGSRHVLEDDLYILVQEWDRISVRRGDSMNFGAGAITVQLTLTVSEETL